MNLKVDKAIKYYKSNGIMETLKKVYRHTTFRLKIKKPRKANEIYKLSKKEKQVLKLKTQKRVFIFSCKPYLCLQENKMELIANTFNSMGYMVKYFYEDGSFSKPKTKMFLPVVEYKKITNKLLENFSKDVKEEDIIIFEKDTESFLPYLKCAQTKKCNVICNPNVDSNDGYALCTNILDSTNTSGHAPSKFYNNISIVILNYNNKNVIERCIDTILKFNERYNAEVIVVDNQSKDGSYELIKEKYKDKIKLYRNEKNGCSSGRNLGVKNASKEYILFLDSDQWVLHKYWLDPYIEILTKDDSIGAISWGAGWFNKEGYSYNVVDSFAFKYMPPMGLYRFDVGYLATDGFIMRKDLFNKVGGFDLNYDPTCYEDTDLALKIRNAGKELAYTSYLGVGHLPHQSTKAGTESHDKLIKNKGDYFVSKWKKINPELLKYIK